MAYFRYDDIAEVLMPQSVECTSPNKVVFRDIKLIAACRTCSNLNDMLCFPAWQMNSGCLSNGILLHPYFCFFYLWSTPFLAKFPCWMVTCPRQAPFLILNGRLMEKPWASQNGPHILPFLQRHTLLIAPHLLKCGCFMHFLCEPLPLSYRAHWLELSLSKTKTVDSQVSNTKLAAVFTHQNLCNWP